MNLATMTNTKAHLLSGAKLLITAATKPVLLIFISYCIYFALLFFTSTFSFFANQDFAQEVAKQILDIIGIVSIFWFAFRLINAISTQTYNWLQDKNYRVGQIIIPVFNQGLKILVALALLNSLVPFLNLAPQYIPILDKITKILLIGAIAWIFIQVISRFEHIILQPYQLQVGTDLKARTLYTQAIVLKRIAITVVIFLSLVAMLMVFDNVRELGASILASAGFASLIVGFAAQRTLGSLFAGLQIAITQPIRINDTVIMENEFGQIEEINLTYAVVKTWDLRRLVIPINYLLEKPFQNWTRSSTNLIGAITLHTDSNAPFEALRNELARILQSSKLWDNKVSNLQVTEMKENTIELRVLVSADNAGDLWNLRCEVREKLITFLQTHHPESLPKARVDVKMLNNSQEHIKTKSTEASQRLSS